MTTVQDRRHLQIQMGEMNRLLEVSKGNPIMEFALQKRLEGLAQEIRALPQSAPVPRAVLFFAGPPVRGSQGIEAEFATEVLQPFLEMVKTQYAAQKHGRVGSRGPRRDESEARMFLTGLPRGSFGLELSQPSASDLFSAEHLSEVLVCLTGTIGSACKTDEEFSYALDSVNPRIIPNLKRFFKVMADRQTYLRLESGDLRVELKPEQVRDAYERVGATESTDREVEMEGSFRGATLDSSRFDFRLQNGELISGKIATDVEESSVTTMLGLLNQQCRARLREFRITTRNGEPRLRYELLGLSSMSHPSTPSS